MIHFWCSHKHTHSNTHTHTHPSRPSLTLTTRSLPPFHHVSLSSSSPCSPFRLYEQKKVDTTTRLFSRNFPSPKCDRSTQHTLFTGTSGSAGKLSTAPVLLRIVLVHFDRTPLPERSERRGRPEKKTPRKRKMVHHGIGPRRERTTAGSTRRTPRDVRNASDSSGIREKGKRTARREEFFSR